LFDLWGFKGLVDTGRISTKAICLQEHRTQVNSSMCNLHTRPTLGSHLCNTQPCPAYESYETALLWVLTFPTFLGEENSSNVKRIIRSGNQMGKGNKQLSWFKSPKPMLLAPSGSQPSSFQIAVKSFCFICLWHLEGNESIIFFFHRSRLAAWKNGLFGSLSSRNWTHPSAHLLPLPLLSMWFSDLSFPLMWRRSADQDTGLHEEGDVPEGRDGGALSLSRCLSSPNPAVPHPGLPTRVEHRIVVTGGFCSKSCGRGLRKRTVFCRSTDPGASAVVVPDSMCKQHHRPKAQETCVLRRCPKNEKLQWIPAPWGEALCLILLDLRLGMPIRTIQCLQQSHASTGCPAHLRPITSRACNTNFCPAAPPAPAPHNRVLAAGPTLKASEGGPRHISQSGAIAHYTQNYAQCCVFSSRSTSLMQAVKKYETLHGLCHSLIYRGEWECSSWCSSAKAMSTKQ
ncbi:hypothetical protein GOODEAATRI_008720, partial [Goodea atripinnis]